MLLILQKKFIGKTKFTPLPGRQNAESKVMSADINGQCSVKMLYLLNKK